MPTEDAHNGKTQEAAGEEISVFALHCFSHYLMIPRKCCYDWSNSPPGKMQALPQAVHVNTDHNGSLFKHTRMVSHRKPPGLWETTTRLNLGTFHSIAELRLI